MKIFVTAKAKARVARLEAVDPSHFVVAVTEPPVDGRANWAITLALARHFGVAPSRFRLLAGRAARQKIFELV